MIGTLLGLLAARAAVAEVINLDGRCQYPASAARYRHETTLILCDQLAIETGEASATLDFGQRSWGSMLRVSGRMSGRRMAVERVTLRSGESITAGGTCEVFYSGARISVVSCLAKAGAKSWAANFVPSRL